MLLERLSSADTFASMSNVSNCRKVRGLLRNINKCATKTNVNDTVANVHMKGVMSSRHSDGVSEIEIIYILTLPENIMIHCFRVCITGTVTVICNTGFSVCFTVNYS